MKKLISSATLALAFALGGPAAAAYAPPAVVPAGIVISTNDSVCGQVTITATGFGIDSGTGYQLVADRAVKTVIASGVTASATFTLAESGAWGVVAIRTSSGGYLAARAALASAPAFAGTAWYHVAACV